MQGYNYKKPINGKETVLCLVKVISYSKIIESFLLRLSFNAAL